MLNFVKENDPRWEQIQQDIKKKKEQREIERLKEIERKKEEKEKRKDRAREAELKRFEELDRLRRERGEVIEEEVRWRMID